MRAQELVSLDVNHVRFSRVVLIPAQERKKAQYWRTSRSPGPCPGPAENLNGAVAGRSEIIPRQSAFGSEGPSCRSKNRGLTSTENVEEAVS